MTGRSDFWERRKAAVRAEEQAETAAVDAQELEAERTALEEKSDEEILAELDLPDPETLKPGDDIRGFMGKAVPDRLRRRALRQLWKLNPVLANVDGLVDYGEDFTDSALVVENLQTAYQVGKGMLAHVEEMARLAEEKDKSTVDDTEAEPEETVAFTDQDGIETPAEEVETLAAQTPDDFAEQTETAPSKEDPISETQQNQSDTRYAAVSKRRMRFAFDG